MGVLTITNLTAAELHVGDWYPGKIEANGTVTLTNRSRQDVEAMTRLAKAVVDGTASYSFALDSDEAESTIKDDPIPVPAATVVSGLELMRKPFTAGVTGTADDVTIFAADAIPAKCRIVDAWAFVVTALGGTTITLRDEAAGAGTAFAAISTAATGRVAASMTSNATDVLTPGSTKGLFMRRSDRAIAGEVFILIRRES